MKRINITIGLLLFFSMLAVISSWYVPDDESTYSERDISQIFEPITTKHNIKIAYKINKDFISAQQSGYPSPGPTEKSQIKPIRPQVLVRYPKILDTALGKYPSRVIDEYLRAIHFAEEIEEDGFKFGGTYEPFGKIIYLTNDGQKSDVRAEYIFHHEFSSILLKRNSFLLNPWFEANPDNFEYFRESGRRWKNIQTSTMGTSADYEKGFLNTYGQTNYENDFNEYAAMIFTHPQKFKQIMNQYPRVRRKFLIWLEFYQAIDPAFTEAFLFGES